MPMLTDEARSWAAIHFALSVFSGRPIHRAVEHPVGGCISPGYRTRVLAGHGVVSSLGHPTSTCKGRQERRFSLRVDLRGQVGCY